MSSNKRSRLNHESNDNDVSWVDPYASDDDEPSRVVLNRSIYTIGNDIYFTAGVNKHTIQEIIRQMTQLIHDHKKKSNGDPDKLTITYIVDSPGGSVTSILKFVDFLSLSKLKYPFVEFVSVISGLVASAGTIMAIAADKRYMTKNAHAMIHELSSGNSCKYTEFKSYIKFLDQLHDKLTNIYIEKTKKSREEIEGLLKNETWFGAEEYKKNGFIDEIK